jgi:septal ring factor EnvC (AmiA/AmiB activator)
MFKVTILLLILLPLMVFPQENTSNNEAELDLKLTRIKQKLKVLKTKLNKAYGTEQALLAKLEEQDISINDLAKNIIKSNEQLNLIDRHVNKITTKIDQKTDSIDTQKQQIIDLVKLQVYLNHDKTLKMLLISPSNSNSIQTKHQIKYLQNRLYSLIKEVAEQIKQLEILKKDQLILQAQEKIKKSALVDQQNNLLAQRNIRLNTLKELKNEIAKHTSQSDSLTKDQNRLQSLLTDIQILLSDLPEDLGSQLPFRKLKGKMFKPVKGEYVRSYNSKRSENTRWNGVVIKANFADNVKAIAYGRVAFSDWLRGFGMLVILDHQDGYMSLYGFNESINVEVGDWVADQQTIATIGNSGTLAMPAVYFEIRKDAKPLNPKLWVK